MSPGWVVSGACRYTEYSLTYILAATGTAGVLLRPRDRAFIPWAGSNLLLHQAIELTLMTPSSSLVPFQIRSFFLRLLIFSFSFNYFRHFCVGCLKLSFCLFLGFNLAIFCLLTITHSCLFSSVL